MLPSLLARSRSAFTTVVCPPIQAPPARHLSVPAAAPAAISSASGALKHWPAAQITELDTGLRIVTEKTAHEQSATVGVYVDTGSRYETKENNGVAHFLEHLFFKGTNRRSQAQLEQEVEDMGAHLNAYTSREHTVFYAKAMNSQIPQAVDILADIITNSKFSEDSVERERGTILREAEEVSKSLNEVIFDDLHAVAYQDCSLGRTILGPEENIKKFTREDILNYIGTHYTQPRIVVCGAGAVDHDQLVQLAQEKFGSLPTEPKTGIEVVKEPAIFTGSDIRTRYDSYPLAHVALAFHGPGRGDPDTFPLMVIQSLLGSWDNQVSGGKHASSSLISDCADGNLAHSVSTFNTQYSDTGLFGIYATAEQYSLEMLTSSMMLSLVELAYNVPARRLEEAKNMLKMQALSVLDGTTPICEDIGRQVVSFGRRMHPLEVLDRIDAVDESAVKGAANRFFYDRDHAMASIGPVYELPDYNALRRKSYWLRY